MRLEWINNLSIVKTTFISGESLEWPCNSWNRSRFKEPVLYMDSADTEVSPDIFNTINAWWTSQTFNKLEEVEKLYHEIYNVFQDVTQINELNAKLNPLIYQLFSTFDWHKFSLWCILNGELNLDIGVKDELGDKDTLELTYFTKDYHELLIFSVILKSIMPIWGIYYNNTKGILGPEHVFIQAIELIRNPYTDENPAFQRLCNYVFRYVSDRIKTTGFSITSDIGSEEIPDYILALAIWKKVCTFDGRSSISSIVRDVHAILKDRCERISRGGPSQKTAYNERGKEISIVDMYKIIDKIAPGIKVLIEFSIRRPNIVNNLGLTQELILTKFNILTENFLIRDFHTTVVSSVSGANIGLRSVLLIDYDAMLQLIAICSAALELWGFKALPKLLISIPEEKNIYSFSSNGHKIQKNITAENQQRLNQMYSISGSSGNINCGTKLIDSIINEVNNFNWPTVEYIEELPNEIAELLFLKDKLNDNVMERMKNEQSKNVY